MSTRACPRLFEVEALRNGRLSGSELEHFQRHLVQCPACSRESEALESLARALRASDDTSAQDQLQVRRERTRLLAAFDRTLVTGPARRPARLFYALAFAVVAVFAAFWLRPSPPPAPAARAQVHPDNGAVWTHSQQPGRERIVLTKGTLSIRVTHHENGAGLLLLLPDGELEDTGTTFSVAVENGRTIRVTVQEGSVVLRLRERPVVSLVAGEIWQAPELPAPSAIPPPAASISPVAPAPAPAPAPARVPALTPSRASEDFRAAVSALNVGNNTDAAVRFERFSREHPRDARSEDAAYLRVLALKRAGNAGAMQAAARQYLDRYPNGFRRREVDQLLE